MRSRGSCGVGWFWKERNVVLGLGVNRDLFCFCWVDTKVVVHRRALDGYRRLLVSRKMRHRRLVEPSTRVNVNSVEDIVVLLRRFGTW